MVENRDDYIIEETVSFSEWMSNDKYFQEKWHNKTCKWVVYNFNNGKRGLNWKTQLLLKIYQNHSKSAYLKNHYKYVPSKTP